ncbi:unnamed protein product, partial [Scytosiphon promiscuus]
PSLGLLCADGGAPGAFPPCSPSHHHHHYHHHHRSHLATVREEPRRATGLPLCSQPGGENHLHSDPRPIGVGLPASGGHEAAIGAGAGAGGCSSGMAPWTTLNGRETVSGWFGG